MNTTHPIDALSQPDRTLIETAIAKRFNLHDLIDPKSAHPAQQSLSSLIRWLDRPLIKLAIDIYMSIFTRSAACAAALDAPHQAAALKSALNAALHMLHNSPTPTDDGHAEVISKRNQFMLREARFLLAAINRFNPFPRVSTRKPTKAELAESATEIAADDASESPATTSNSATTRARTSGNATSSQPNSPLPHPTPQSSHHIAERSAHDTNPLPQQTHCTQSQAA